MFCSNQMGSPFVLMRLFTLGRLLLVPAVASAQSVAGASVGSQVVFSEVSFGDRLDVLPAAAADPTVIGSTAAALGVAACVIVTGLTQEDVTFNQSLIAAGVCGVLAGAAVCVNAQNTPERVHVASGARYDTEAIAAFAAGALSSDLQASLAASAREADRAGVGGVPGQAVLEVSIVDAETGALRSLDADALLPRTVASVPVGDDLSSAQAEAVASFTL
ncbi:MAG: hypothetical protein Rubg2KO_02450 [Rubricoccaceae bacterium]